MQRLSDFLDALARRLDRVSWFDWTAIVTGLVVSFMGLMTGITFYAVTSVMFFAIILLARPLRRRAGLWFFIVAIWLPRLVFGWHSVEDHVYFAIYWCGAIGLTLVGRNHRSVLTFNARMLIALSFVFAIFWKLISPPFHDGSMFHYKLLTDHRFSSTVAYYVGGLDADWASVTRQSLSEMRSPESRTNTVRLQYPAAISTTAIAMSYWTIFIEGFLAILFVLPARRAVRLVRNGALIIFIVTTYAIVPVLCFAGLFTAMGIAQTKPCERKTRMAYLAALLLSAGIFLTRFVV